MSPIYYAGKMTLVDPDQYGMELLFSLGWKEGAYWIDDDGIVTIDVWLPSRRGA